MFQDNPFLNQFFTFSDGDLISFFFKIFGVALSLLFVLYGIVVVRQTTILNKTLTTTAQGVMSTVSTLLLLVGIFVFLVAVFLI
jgi:hypothetical protein